MSYTEALKAAGVTILAFKEFGSYQGEWYAHCEYLGERGWIQGSYGSCSGCDSFQAEFGWDAEDDPDYQTRLADFGRGYLPMVPASAILARLEKDAEWDAEAEEAAEWIAEEERTR